MSKELTIKDNFEITQPSKMSEMATILKNHIVKQKLFTPICGKNYIQVEGWQFAGGMLGIFPRVKAVVDMSTDKEIKWKATVELVDKQDKIVSIGVAICSNKESKKKTFDEYAILSMAQTRAIGKAYRNVIGWVMKLAGYEPTPAEEIKEEKPKVTKEKEEITKITAESIENKLNQKQQTNQIKDKIKNNPVFKPKTK